MHHSIWVEHDGSWTWSIEEGKAFEDDHKVLARDDGFPTRGDAKEDMQLAWAKLLGQGKKPGRPGKAKTANGTSPTKKKTGKASVVGKNSGDHQQEFSSVLPEWGVIVDGKIIALFANKTAAQKYAKAHHAKTHSVRKLGFGGVLR